MASKLLTDSQLDLLANGIINKIKDAQALKQVKVSKNPAFTTQIAKVRKAAEAYETERQKLLSITSEVSGFSNNNNRPDVVDLSDFDKHTDWYNDSYSKLKSGYKSNDALSSLRNIIKTEILRESISTADLEKVLANIEKKHLK